MPIGGKDAFLSKVIFRRESKWYSKTKQELKDMATIEERAKEQADRHKATEINYFGVGNVYGYERIYNAEITAYERGATEQKAIDEEVRLKKCDDMTEAEYNHETAFVDWYHKNGKGTPTFSDAIEWARKEMEESIWK